MLYFKVKSQYDNHHRNDGSILVGNELYTRKEKEKLHIPDVCVRPVFVPKNDTYFFFGARFQMGKEMEI